MDIDKQMHNPYRVVTTRWNIQLALQLLLMLTLELSIRNATPQSFKFSTTTFRRTYKHSLSHSWKNVSLDIHMQKGDENTHIDTYGNNIKWKLPLFPLVHILLPPSKWKFIYPFTFSSCLVMLLRTHEKVLYTTSCNIL